MPSHDTPIPPPLQKPQAPARSVLLVEDEPTIRMIARTALKGAGFVVSEAGDLAAAAESVRTAARPFALVLLDRNLPDGEGAALIPLIRRHAPGTRVLVVSGSGDDDPAAVGADGYLSKPFTRAPLLLAVQRVLNPTDQTTPTKPA
jgi:DNA-binding response OmpR family regulator